MHPPAFRDCRGPGHIDASPETHTIPMKWSFIKMIKWWTITLILLEKWGISCDTLVDQPHPSSPHATLHPTQSIRPNVLRQISLHTNIIHNRGQNALVEIFTDIPNTQSCVISGIKPPKRLLSRVPLTTIHIIFFLMHFVLCYFLKVRSSWFLCVSYWPCPTAGWWSHSGIHRLQPHDFYWYWDRPALGYCTA